MLDLAPIKARHAAAAMGHRMMDAVRDIPALVAEVERLRAVVEAQRDGMARFIKSIDCDLDIALAASDEPLASIVRASLRTFEERRALEINE